jgi:hypothetical protein
MRFLAKKSAFRKYMYFTVNMPLNQTKKVLLVIPEGAAADRQRLSYITTIKLRK